MFSRFILLLWFFVFLFQIFPNYSFCSLNERRLLEEEETKMVSNPLRSSSTLVSSPLLTRADRASLAAGGHSRMKKAVKQVTALTGLGSKSGQGKDLSTNAGPRGIGQQQRRASISMLDISSEALTRKSSLALSEEPTLNVALVNKKIMQVHLLDERPITLERKLWGVSFLVGWAVMAGTWNIFVDSAYGIVEQIPKNYADYDRTTAPGNMAAMALQSIHGNLFLIIVKTMQSKRMIGRIRDHIHHNSDIVPADKILVRFKKILNSFRKSTFPEPESLKTKKALANSVALVYSMVDATPGLLLLVNNLFATKNFWTPFAVPFFYIGNVYERFENSQLLVNKLFARLNKGKTSDVVDARQYIIQRLENAAFNTRHMRKNDVTTYYDFFKFRNNGKKSQNRILEYKGAEREVPNLPTADPTKDPFSNAIAILLSLGNETTALAIARKEGKESTTRKIVRWAGRAVGAASAWGTYTLMKGVVSQTFKNAGLDETSADGFGTCVGVLFGGGLRGLVKNVKGAEGLFTRIYDGWTNSRHYLDTGEYNENVSTSVSCKTGATMGLWNYVEGIYFSAPLLSILWPVIKEWPAGQIAGLLTTFYLGEGAVLGGDFDRSLREFFAEIHRANCGKCRQTHKVETHRSHLLRLIDSTIRVVKHLPDPLLLAFHRDMVSHNDLIVKDV